MLCGKSQKKKRPGFRVTGRELEMKQTCRLREEEHARKVEKG